MTRPRSNRPWRGQVGVGTAFLAGFLLWPLIGWWTLLAAGVLGVLVTTGLFIVIPEKQPGEESDT